MKRSKLEHILENTWGRKVIIVKKSRETRYRDLVYKIEGLKEVTGYIKFGCDFKDNRCERYAYHSNRGTPASCCNNCAVSFGYLSFILEKDLDFVVDSYDRKTGFWRINTGCSLPRKLRALECVIYNCTGTLDMGAFRLILRGYEKVLIKEFGEPISESIN